MTDRRKRNRSAFGLALAIGLACSLASAAAVNRDSLLPWSAFVLSLHAQKGVYYLVSPGVVEKCPPASGIGEIDASYRRLELKPGYVVIYGVSERIASRIELAKRNMALIGSALRTSRTKLVQEPLTAGGVLDLKDEYKMTANYPCGLEFIGVPRSSVTGALAGEGLSATRVCIGFGIIAGLAGYRIHPGAHALELQRVIDVTQGARTASGSF